MKAAIEIPSYFYSGLDEDTIKLSKELDSLGGGDAKALTMDVIAIVANERAKKKGSQCIWNYGSSVGLRDVFAPKSSTIDDSIKCYRVSQTLPFDALNSNDSVHYLDKPVNLFFQGFNSCVITYGGRGSGKSFSMFGTSYNVKDIFCLDDIPHCFAHSFLRELFFTVENSRDKVIVGLSAWFLQGQNVVDVCTSEKTDRGLDFATISCPDLLTALEVLRVARSRCPSGVAAYDSNSTVPDDSNSAHFFFRVILHTEYLVGSRQGTSRTSSFHIVDLTGTASVDDVGFNKLTDVNKYARRDRHLQFQSLNKVLLEMKDSNKNPKLTVSESLLQPWSKNAISNSPLKVTSARDSKLTMLLAPLLQGNCYTTWLLYLLDGEDHFSSSRQSLLAFDGCTEINIPLHRVQNVLIDSFSWTPSSSMFRYPIRSSPKRMINDTSSSQSNTTSAASLEQGWSDLNLEELAQFHVQDFHVPCHSSEKSCSKAICDETQQVSVSRPSIDHISNPKLEEIMGQFHDLMAQIQVHSPSLIRSPEAMNGKHSQSSRSSSPFSSSREGTSFGHSVDDNKFFSAPSPHILHNSFSSSVSNANMIPANVCDVASQFTSSSNVNHEKESRKTVNFGEDEYGPIENENCREEDNSFDMEKSSDDLMLLDSLPRPPLPFQLNSSDKITNNASSEARSKSDVQTNGWRPWQEVKAKSRKESQRSKEIDILDSDSDSDSFHEKNNILLKTSNGIFESIPHENKGNLELYVPISTALPPYLLESSYGKSSGNSVNDMKSKIDSESFSSGKTRDFGTKEFDENEKNSINPSETNHNPNEFENIDNKGNRGNKDFSIRQLIEENDRLRSTQGALMEALRSEKKERSRIEKSLLVAQEEALEVRTQCEVEISTFKVENLRLKSQLRSMTGSMEMTDIYAGFEEHLQRILRDNEDLRRRNLQFELRDIDHLKYQEEDGDALDWMEDESGGVRPNSISCVKNGSSPPAICSKSNKKKDTRNFSSIIDSRTSKHNRLCQKLKQTTLEREEWRLSFEDGQKKERQFLLLQKMTADLTRRLKMALNDKDKLKKEIEEVKGILEGKDRDYRHLMQELQEVQQAERQLRDERARNHSEVAFLRNRVKELDVERSNLSKLNRFVSKHSPSVIKNENSKGSSTGTPISSHSINGGKNLGKERQGSSPFSSSPSSAGKVPPSSSSGYIASPLSSHSSSFLSSTSMTNNYSQYSQIHCQKNQGIDIPQLPCEVGDFAGLPEAMYLRQEDSEALNPELEGALSALHDNVVSHCPVLLPFYRRLNQEIHKERVRSLQNKSHLLGLLYKYHHPSSLSSNNGTITNKVSDESGTVNDMSKSISLQKIARKL